MSVSSANLKNQMFKLKIERFSHIKKRQELDEKIKIAEDMLASANTPILQTQKQAFQQLIEVKVAKKQEHTSTIQALTCQIQALGNEPSETKFQLQEKLAVEKLHAALCQSSIENHTSSIKILCAQIDVITENLNTYRAELKNLDERSEEITQLLNTLREQEAKQREDAARAAGQAAAATNNTTQYASDMHVAQTQQRDSVVTEDAVPSSLSKGEGTFDCRPS